MVVIEEMGSASVGVPVPVFFGVFGAILAVVAAITTVTVASLVWRCELLA